jgi:hypothetical protein
MLKKYISALTGVPEGDKKPALREKERVFLTSLFTAFHRRPIVKCIQAGFLAYGSPYFLPLPIPPLR